jgi:large subunit ribosomal protein L6
MSRIGKLPVELPKGVTINVGEGNIVTVKGPKGELKQWVNPVISLETMEDGTLVLKRQNDEKSQKSLHGLYRALMFNMVKGVTEGFTTIQELYGVGYKAEAKGQALELSLGYSHGIYMVMPEEVTVETVNERGKPPTIILKSINKEIIGQVAAKIRSLRPPEPYKGKGIRFKGEVVRKKAGKSAVQK